jgi:hypothetical protein
VSSLLKRHNKGYGTGSVDSNDCKSPSWNFCKPKTLKFCDAGLIGLDSGEDNKDQAINEISSLYLTNKMVSPHKIQSTGQDLKKFSDTLGCERFSEYSSIKKQHRYSEIKISNLKSSDSVELKNGPSSRNSPPKVSSDEGTEMITSKDNHSSRSKVNIPTGVDSNRKRTGKTTSAMEITMKNNSLSLETEEALASSNKKHKSGPMHNSHTENLSLKTTGKTNSTLFNSWCLSENFEVKPLVKHFYQTLMKSLESINSGPNTETQNPSGTINPTTLNFSDLQILVYGQLEELVISFDDLEIDELIASGGTSNVFFGSYRFCDVAIKRMSLSQMTTKEIKQVLTEISCMKKIRHPNIAMIIGISIDAEDYLYMVLEYYQYQNLQDFYRKHKDKTKLINKVNILFDVAKALNYLHYNSPTI